MFSSSLIPAFNRFLTPPTGVAYYETDVKSYSDFYPFGMLMNGRFNNNQSYNFGMHGMIKNDDWKKANGSDYDFNGYGYSSLLGRRKNIDPAFKEFSAYSPYGGFNNNPISNIDEDGLRVKPLNKEAFDAFNSYLYSFGDKESINKVFNLSFDRNSNITTNDVGGISQRDFNRKLRQEGIRLNDSDKQRAYNTYLTITSNESIEIEIIKAGEPSFTLSDTGESGTRIEGENNTINVNPELLEFQRDVLSAGGEPTPEIVNEMFNPVSANEKYDADQRGKEYTFFKGVAPDSRAVQNGGGIKGTILINGTDKTTSEMAQIIGKALDEIE